MEIPVYDIAGKTVTIFPMTPMEGEAEDADTWLVTIHGTGEMPTAQEVIDAFTIPVHVTAVTPTRYKVEKKEV